MTDFEYLENSLAPADIWQQLAEEAAELSQAASKMERLLRGTNPPRKSEQECINDVNEECADVRLCLDLLHWGYEAEQEAIREKKTKRWADIIRGVRASVENKSEAQERLIDANALWQEINNVGGCGAEPDSWADGWDKGINEAIRLVEEAPTIDWESLRPHAKWAWEDSVYGWDWDLRCSNCHHKAPMLEHEAALETYMTSYCPHCGAKMGDNDGN